MSQKAATIETLPDDLRATVEEDVRAGEFADADQAIRQAILSQHERLALRRSLVEARAQIERGNRSRRSSLALARTSLRANIDSNESKVRAVGAMRSMIATKSSTTWRNAAVTSRSPFG
jgi:Arc/MetJ-type ribon-helix-helix transcriptional regulator